MSHRRPCTYAAVLLTFAAAGVAAADPIWPGYAGNAQHTALSTVASQPLQAIIWSTPVDLQPKKSSGNLLVHYGSPSITAANTVIVPVKTGLNDGFQISAFNGANGAALWTLPTDYSLPPANWTPSYSGVLTPSQRLYFPGAGGTLYYRDSPDAPAGATGQIAFYGNGTYGTNKAAYDAGLKICTPLTSDAAGNIYFGYRVTGGLPAGGPVTSSGIARVTPSGTATYVPITTAAMGDAAISSVNLNCAPAISNDGQTVYVALTTGSGGLSSTGYLVALNSTTLLPTARVALQDPRGTGNAALTDDSTASPLVGPDGDVYYGVLERGIASNNFRGWMLHYSADLSQTKTAGAFGWDDTASVVPASMVPSYAGTSSYLLMTKYNNYVGIGTGNGDNKLAILDPNATMIDPITGATVMKEILTISGVTPDGPAPAVREWCINTAVVDPATGSILVNSEDGKLYRWDLSTNSLTQAVTLTAGLGEAYTPTLIGADGKVYAINDATLFAVGAVPEPGTMALLAAGALLLVRRRKVL